MRRALALTLALSALVIGLAASAPLAQAEQLPQAEIEKLPQIAEWTYRNGAIINPDGCAALCIALWAAEHEPMPNHQAAKEIWNSLGTLEEQEHYWPPAEDYRLGFGSQPLTTARNVGWEIGTEVRKWLALFGASPLVAPGPGCPEGADNVEMPAVGGGYRASNQFCPSEVVAKFTGATRGPCVQSAGPTPLGFELAQIQINTCEQEVEPGHKETFPVYGLRAAEQFNWTRPEDGPTSSGNFTTLIQTPGSQISGSHTPAQLLEDLPKYLEESQNATLNQWIRYHLLGEGKDPTLLGFSPEERLGLGNEGERGLRACHVGEPVDCATGNQAESQTDLRVEGRGPGLTWTRTYNSQLAARQAQPGPFGYGWSTSYSAHITTSQGTKSVTVHQDNASTVSFEENAEGKYVGINPLVESKLAKEGSGYLYTLPDQSKLEFNASGQLVKRTDRYGSAVSLTYESGRLTKIADEAGRALTLAYKEGLLESVKDPMGHTVLYTYGSGAEASALKSVTEPGESSARWSFGYNSLHELTTLTDGRSHTAKTEYDALGRVREQTDAMGRKRTWAYRVVGPELETTITEPNGSTTVEQFNSIGEPTTVTRGSGSELVTTTGYSYDANDRLHLLTDGNHHATEYEYSPEGDLLRLKDAAGHETKWTYDSTHDVHTSTTPNGETTTIEREANGNAKAVKRPAPGGKEEETRYTYYNTEGKEKALLKSATVVLGPSNERTSEYGYDSYGDRTSETDPEGDKRTFAYNQDSQLVSTVSPRGNSSEGEPLKFTTAIERDQQGRPTVVTEPSESFLESSFANSKIEVPNGLAIDSAHGHVFVSDSWHSRVEEFAESGGTPTEIGKGEGEGAEEFKNPRQLAVDEQGNLWIADSGHHRIDKFNLEKGKVEVTEINKQGTAPGQLECPSSVAIDTEKNVWVTDACNDRVTEFNQSGVAEREFGKKGEREDESPESLRWPEGISIDRSGNAWVSDWGDSRIDELKPVAGKLELIKQFGMRGEHPRELALPDGIAVGPEGNIFVSDYQNGRLQVFNSSGTFLATIGTSSSGNGLLGGPGQQAVPTQSHVWVTQRSGPQVQHWRWFLPETKYAYDRNGNVESVTNPDAHTTKYEYDEDNELRKVTQPSGTQKTEYDPAGQVTAQIDGNEQKTEYKRNAVEQVAEVIDPRSRHTVKKYDLAGNLKSVTFPGSSSPNAEYAYDAANHLEKVTYPNSSTPTVEYRYDPDGNRTETSDGTGKTKYTFDQLDRLTKAEDLRTLPAPTEVVGYEYDLANELTKLAYPSTKAVERSYDKAGRLKSIKDFSTNETTFEYNPNSDLIKTVFPSTSTNEDRYAYNEADQMTEATMSKGATTEASLVYRRDGEGNVIKTITTRLPEAGPAESSYDENGRLKSAGSTSYEYDLASNLKKIGSTTQSFDEANQLKESGSTKYSYNELGERTEGKPASGPATTYGYNQAEQLTSVNRPEGPKIEDSYAYNGEGLRASQTMSGSTTYISWDTAEGLPLMLSDGTSSYVYGPGGAPIEQVSNGGTVSYLHHDQQGSTRLLTNSSGEAVGRCSYSAYGKATCEGSTTTTLQYDGQYTNADTGLQYLRARSYDSGTGQFMSVDPLGEITREPYSYGVDAPLTYGDPTGLGLVHDLEGVAEGGLHGVQWLAYQDVKVAAWFPYAAYYGAYRTLSTVGSVPIVGKPLTLAPPFDSLYATEYWGLNMDRELDNVKRALVCNADREADEGRGVPTDPFHILPEVYGPGLHPVSGREDLYPAHTYPWWESISPNRSPNLG